MYNSLTSQRHLQKQLSFFVFLPANYISPALLIFHFLSRLCLSAPSWGTNSLFVQRLRKEMWSSLWLLPCYVYIYVFAVSVGANKVYLKLLRSFLPGKFRTRTDLTRKRVTEFSSRWYLRAHRITALRCNVLCTDTISTRSRMKWNMERIFINVNAFSSSLFNIQIYQSSLEDPREARKFDSNIFQSKRRLRI